MSFTSIPLYRAKQDVINLIKRLGYEIKEVASCNANIKYRDDYARYVYSEDFPTLESKIKTFLDTVTFKEAGKPILYIWTEYEGNYRYLNVGYFLPKKSELTELVILTIGVSQT